MRFIGSFLTAICLGSFMLTAGAVETGSVTSASNAGQIPSLSNASLVPVPEPTSPAGMAREFEIQMGRVQGKIAARKKALTNENADVRSASEALNTARAGFATLLAGHPDLARHDSERHELLKSYAQLESRFNRFRIHWMTHNKPVRLQDGTPVSSNALPLQGCPDCQHEFDKFVAADPELMKEYQQQAARMLTDLQRKRALLLPMTVGRAEEVRRVTAGDPLLVHKSQEINGLEQKLALLHSEDHELVELQRQLDDLRAKMLAVLPTNARTPTFIPRTGAAPRSRTRPFRGLGLRVGTLRRKFTTRPS